MIDTPKKESKKKIKEKKINFPWLWEMRNREKLSWKFEYDFEINITLLDYYTYGYDFISKDISNTNKVSILLILY